jgi:hypothetical protein
MWYAVTESPRIVMQRQKHYTVVEIDDDFILLHRPLEKLGSFSKHCSVMAFASNN